MFPGAGASVYYNKAGEPLGWGSPSYDEPPEPEDFGPEEDEPVDDVDLDYRDDPDQELKMPTTPRNKRYIEDLNRQGVIRFLYSSAPTPSTDFYVFETKDEHGDTQEHKVPSRELYTFLCEAEAAAKHHSHRFPPPVVRR